MEKQANRLIQKSMRRYTYILLVFGMLSIGVQQKTFAQVTSEKQEIKTYTLGDIKISGDVTFNTNTIKTYAGLEKGQKINLPGDALSDAIKKLWSVGYFSDVKIFETKRENDVLDIEIYLNELPKIHEVEITNLKKSKREELLKELGLYKEKDASFPKSKVANENLIKNTENYIKNKYREKGYYNAKVTIEQKKIPGKNAVDLVIHFDKGKKVKIEEIAFHGNENLTDRQLKKAMKKTKERSPLNPLRIFTPSKFIEKRYEEDLKNIVKKYKENGYRDARITEEKYTYNPDNNRVNIDININEGKKYYVGDIRFVGNTEYTDEQLKRILGIRKGDVYNGVLLDKRVQNLEDPDATDIYNLYQNNGYLFSRINLVERNTRQDTIDFDVKIYEGSIAKYNKISVAGNDKTHDYIILRELSTLPGNIWKRSDIFESMRRIGSMNLFDAQNIHPEVKNVDPVSSTVDVEWQVIEQGQSQIEVQGGYGGGTFIGTLALSFNNFSIRNLFNKKAYTPFPMGDAQKLSLRAQAATYFQTYSLSFTEPWLGGKKPVSLFGSISHNRQSAYSYTGTVDRDQKLNITSINVGLAKRLSDPIFSISHALNFQNYELKNYETSYFAFKNGTSKNLAYQIELTRDNRGGISPAIYPSAGSVMSISAKMTFPYSLVNGVDYANLENQEEYKVKTTEIMTNPETGADIPVGSYLDENGLPVANYQDAAVNEEKINQTKFNWLEYYKISVKADWYTTLVDKLVLRTTGQFGFLGAYNQDRGIIPFERYYMGGSGMMNFSLDGRENLPMRGYEDNALNKRNVKGNPIGGTVYNRFSLELRYPITLKAQMSAYVLGFFDAGAVYDDFSSYKPFELKRSAGAGVRLFMPMFGILGFDFGYGFDKAVGSPNISGWQTHFILGQQF